MGSTDANTLALNFNTIVVLVGAIITIILAKWGYPKIRGLNIVKRVLNRRGKISQSSKDNVIQDVDNDDGEIIQN